MKARVTFILTILVLSLLTTAFTTYTANAASAGDDSDTPPTTSGGGGGGGGPDFYDYYIPLVFNGSHPHGQSEVIVFIQQPTVIITSFALNDLGINVAQITQPVELRFNPTDNNGLTNGSLVRVTSPTLVTGQRISEDINNDYSFAYSILPRRMMGFEYTAPFDGTISLFTLNAGVEVQITAPDGKYRSNTFPIPGQYTVDVVAGSYINSSFPTIGAFYTYQKGSAASMAVPRYLHGNEYYFDGDLASPREEEIDRSDIFIVPSEPTDLTFFYKSGQTRTVNIYSPSSFALTSDLVGVSSGRGFLGVSMNTRYDYGGLTRTSTVQLIDGNEMRAGEVFSLLNGYTTHVSFIKQVTTYNLSRIDFDNQNLQPVSRENFEILSRSALRFNELSNDTLLFASEQVFSMFTLPGKRSHPMSPSIAFLNLPLNSRSLKNITGLESTWYRFANLAIKTVKVTPGPLEEYTGQTILIEVVANGSLPASAFNLEIELDDEIVVEERFDFLQVGEVVKFELREFIPYGKDELSIKIDVDTENEVSEISEDDNNFDEVFAVANNIRLRVTVYLAIVILLSYSLFRFRQWIKNRSKQHRSHVDAILTFEEN